MKACINVAFDFNLPEAFHCVLQSFGHHAYISQDADALWCEYALLPQGEGVTWPECGLDKLSHCLYHAAFSCLTLADHLV